MLKVLHISTSDIEGGAARATYRLHRGLLKQGVASQMLVRAKRTNDSSVIVASSFLTKLGPPMSSLPLRKYPAREKSMFSSQGFFDALAAQADRLNPDLIHLHWICNGFLRIETLAKFKQPIVWTIHDMWSFTGGCHYAQKCQRYQDSCGSCPHLKSDRQQDLSRQTWRRKAKAWHNLNLTIVSPSKWLAQCARQSSLFKQFRVEVVPHGLNLKKYQPVDRATSRSILHLPQNKQLIAFGAVTNTTDRRKGFYHLKAALEILSKLGWQDKIELIIFGKSSPNQFADLEFTVHCLGKFQDDLSLSVVYSAADLTVVSSTQEAFGQVASESLACGTPVAAFGATGLLDIIEHQQNGYLAKPFKAEDLAQGIIWLLEDAGRYALLCQRARQRAKREFALKLQAERYVAIYDSITV